MIEANALSVSLGQTQVVHEVCLQVPAGGWLMLIGPNGAGKSTVLRAISGLLPYAGSVKLDGAEVSAMRPRRRARRVAYLPQSPQLPAEMSVWEYASLGRTPHLGYLGRGGEQDRHAVERALSQLELTAMAHRRLATLSGGERQRVVLARAIAQQAGVLLLDEPTSALDVGRQQDVLELVGELRRRQGLTVLGALHDLTLAGQHAETLLLLDRGRATAYGPPHSVLEEPLLNRHYRARLRVGTPAGHGLVVTPRPPVRDPAPPFSNPRPAAHDPRSSLSHPWPPTHDPRSSLSNPRPPLSNP